MSMVEVSSQRRSSLTTCGKVSNNNNKAIAQLQETKITRVKPTKEEIAQVREEIPLSMPMSTRTPIRWSTTWTWDRARALISTSERGIQRISRWIPRHQLNLSTSLHKKDNMKLRIETLKEAAHQTRCKRFNWASIRMMSQVAPHLRVTTASVLQTICSKSTKINTIKIALPTVSLNTRQSLHHPLKRSIS